MRIFIFTVFIVLCILFIYDEVSQIEVENIIYNQVKSQSIKFQEDKKTGNYVIEDGKVLVYDIPGKCELVFKSAGSDGMLEGIEFKEEFGNCKGYLPNY